MDKSTKNAAGELVGYSTLMPDAERCARCGKTIFYRVTLNGEVLFVHGDKTVCAARVDEA